ncbi:SDR family oxidoreductase [Pedobacter changchengzhani]|uniref:SDR family oxidoreductase n=1 Tax=Pedobacter changchengzhani TaxID=2529274 RepID=A0A4V3A096_9SPHI|nr:SDR family oxidoreductase [Pedobacter changchengzhani]TDG36763.1 SDR family oxidoreductase [Pedobacter changchengzhani]
MENFNKETISILGCGWFGFALAKRLIGLHYTVKGSTTTSDKLPALNESKIQPYLINFTADEVVCEDSFFDADVLFICIPPKRSSPELKDYPNKIKMILDLAKGKTKNIILISSTSVYGDENKAVTEYSGTHPETDSGKLVLEAEHLFKNLNPENFTIIRFAGLIGPERNPGRFFAGKKDIPNGLTPVNLIHQTDAVGIACAILEKQAFGFIYNACNPNHPTKQDFYTTAAKDADLIEPSFISEKTAWKIVESINVPKYLGYEFEVEL